jgi:RimJ/RimL family protein N-acetyltransferase
MEQVIETGRCVLRPAGSADQDELIALYGNERVRQFLGGVVNSVDAVDRVKRMLEDPTATSWIIRRREDGAFVGMVVIDEHHEGREREIWFQLVPTFWRKGLAKEAVGAVIDHEAKALKLTCLVAETQSANARSRRLLERLGMEPVRTLMRFGEEQVIYRADFSTAQPAAV